MTEIIIKTDGIDYDSIEKKAKKKKASIITQYNQTKESIQRSIERKHLWLDCSCATCEKKRQNQVQRAKKTLALIEYADNKNKRPRRKIYQD